MDFSQKKKSSCCALVRQRSRPGAGPFHRGLLSLVLCCCWAGVGCDDGGSSPEVAEDQGIVADASPPEADQGADGEGAPESDGGPDSGSDGGPDSGLTPDESTMEMASAELHHFCVGCQSVSVCNCPADSLCIPTYSFTHPISSYCPKLCDSDADCRAEDMDYICMESPDDPEVKVCRYGAW